MIIIKKRTIANIVIIAFLSLILVSCVDNLFENSVNSEEEEELNPFAREEPEFKYRVIYEAVDSVFNIVYQNEPNYLIYNISNEDGFHFPFRGYMQGLVGWNDAEGVFGYGNKWYWSFVASADLYME